MSYVMTYDSLVQDLERYTERYREDDRYVIQIPRIIAMSEQMLARDFKTLGNIVAVTGTMTPNVSVLDKPGRWRATVSMNYGSGTGFNTRNTLYERTYEFCREYAPNPTAASSSSPPKYYADYDYSHWLLAPTPALAYPFEVLYWQLPLPIDSSNQTNWFTQFSPDILLAACMLNSMPFLKDGTNLPVWKGFYDGAKVADSVQTKFRTSDRSTAIKEMMG